MPNSPSGRPREITALLNPAFCAILLCEAARGAKQEAAPGLPFLLSFFVLPLTLHKPTRTALPKAISKRMHAWVEENQVVRIGFADRMRSLVQYTTEGMVYGCAGNLLELSSPCLTATKKQIRNLGWPDDSEAETCRQKARFVGRWLVHAGDQSTILAIWGVRP